MQPKILALDLGTKMGYALNSTAPGQDGPIRWEEAGTLTLATAKEIKEAGINRTNRRCDPRICKLLDFLGTHGSSVDIIVFEDVQFGSTTMQAHLWASFRTAIWAYKCLNLGSPLLMIDCLATGALKKFATGNGAAKKPQMRQALLKNKSLFPFDNLEALDDNGIDACWLWAWAQNSFKNYLA